MKRLNFFFRIWLLAIILASPLLSIGQMIINSGPEITPIDMVECILGEGVQYANVTFQGADISRGIFSNGYSTNIGIDKGIFLTSGKGNYIPGPNTDCFSTASLSLGGHPLLESICTSVTNDACVLEFDVIPESDTLKLSYVFGSEEYNEWVNAQYNDVIGFFVSGPNPSGGYYFDKNIAIVPGTTNTPISVNNVNYGNSECNLIPDGPCTNCEFFIDNTGGLTIEYDGFTTLLTAWLLVNPCEEYHLTLGIADAVDGGGDSGVLIAENSITCPVIEVEAHLNPPDIENSMVEGFIDSDIVFKLLYPVYTPLTVYLEIVGTANPSAYPVGDFEEAIPLEITIEEDEDSVAMNIVPIYDGIIEGEEYLELHIENSSGCVTRYDTITSYIQDYVEINLITSPNTMICKNEEAELVVQVYNGFPPYNFSWEPGGFTGNFITVSPDTTTTYYVTCTDLTMNSVMDSILVTIFPFCDLETFYFEANLNSGLPYDVFGNVTGDTVFIVFPPGTNLNDLIPSFTFSNEECSDTVGTITDFTEPLVYQFIGPGGCVSEWIVIADVEVSQNEHLKNGIQIYPNPVKDNLIISNALGNELTVLNSMGAIIMKRTIKDSNFSLDVSDFVEGVYYLQFNNKADSFVEKVIIRK